MNMQNPHFETGPPHTMTTEEFHLLENFFDFGTTHKSRFEFMYHFNTLIQILNSDNDDLKGIREETITFFCDHLKAAKKEEAYNVLAVLEKLGFAKENCDHFKSAIG